MAVVDVETLQLPDILARVLQHVDTKQCITCCSLVSRTWNTAAGAATTSIRVYIREACSSSKVISLHEWLARHGIHLTSLTISGSSSLSLAPRIAPCLQHLRQLELSDGKMVASLSQEEISMLSCSLTALTRLNLDFRQMDLQAVGSLRFLSSLDALQEFHFGTVSISAALTAADPRCLPLSLTRLEMLDLQKQQVRMAIGTASLLPLLTNLQHLYVLERAQRSIQLGASVLSHLVQLTNLVYCVVVDLEWREADTATLLSGVRHLTRLQHLRLGSTLKAASRVIEQYSTLTSSNILTHLSLHWCRMPGEYLHHMLPLQRQFTALKVLDVGWQYVVGRKARDSLTYIITTCPNLQELTVSCSAKESPQLKQLTQLSKLTSLTVSSQNFNRGFVPALMQLAELQDLSLCQYRLDVRVDNEHSDASDDSDSDSDEAAGSLSPASLWELRHLTQLTKLHVGEGLCREVPKIWLEKKPLSPEVWQQLNTRLMHIPQLACLISPGAEQ